LQGDLEIDPSNDAAREHGDAVRLLNATNQPHQKLGRWRTTLPRHRRKRNQSEIDFCSIVSQVQAPRSRAVQISASVMLDDLRKFVEGIGEGAQRER
jgi:hypothetical protein